MRYRRKLQVVGGSTYTVSLPKEWVKSVGLSNGSEIVLEVMPDLTIRVAPSEESLKESSMQNEIEISLESMDISFIELIASYVVGYDIILVKCRDCRSEVLEEFMKLVIDRTIGLEVIEKNKDSVVFQCLANVSTLPLTEVLKTIIKLTIKSFEETERLLESGESSLAKEILERDNLIDKLYLYSLRQLNQVLLGRINYSLIGLKSIADAMYVAMMLKFLERIADHVAELAKDITTHNNPKNLIKLSTHLRALREKYVQLSNLVITKQTQKDLSWLNSLIKDLKNIELNIVETSTRPGFEESNHLVRISAYLRDLIEMLVDLHMLSKIISSD